MNPPTNNHQARFRRIWRKLGGSSLSASVAFHIILLIVLSLWALQSLPPKEKENVIDFMLTGGGGGDPAASEQSMRQGHLNFANQRMARITAKDLESMMPSTKPFETSPLKSPLQLDAITRSVGMGGSGAGGGLGDGHGKGFGSGTGIGKGAGRGFRNPFGMLDPDLSALAGTFYNLNRDSSGKLRQTGYEEYHRLASRFVNEGWNKSLLSGYQEAENRLYLPHLYMPIASAGQAPLAFGQPADAHPYWLLVYRGTVVAPKTGKFRFVGAGDDVLAVRFDKTNVFDHGYLEPTSGTSSPGSPMTLAAPIGTPLYPVPKLAYYSYPNTRDWNSNLRGMAAGPAFDVVEGQEYPIEILIAEGQGNLFAAALLIEEIGVTYPKVLMGSPILPLFRTDHSYPAPPRADNAPPYLLDSPVWKVVKYREKI